MAQMALPGAFLPIWEKAGTVVGLSAGTRRGAGCRAPFCGAGSLRIWGALFKKITNEPCEHNAKAPLET